MGMFIYLSFTINFDICEVLCMHYLHCVSITYYYRRILCKYKVDLTGSKLFVEYGEFKVRIRTQ